MSRGAPGLARLLLGRRGSRLARGRLLGCHLAQFCASGAS
jgi:hypothetical protein